MAEKYLEWMAIKNYSERTIRNGRVHLGYFFAWCEERGLTKPAEITKPIIERYQRYLFHYQKKWDGKPLPAHSQRTRLTPIRTYFKWLAKNNHILYNPASDIEMPRTEFRLPPPVLTASEAEHIINLPDIKTPIGIRDRAILETFYSTGIRRLELINLSIYDLNPERGTLMIRQGKGKKDRMVPIGERAIQWAQKYLYEVRPSLVVFPDHGTLFLTTLGEYFGEHRLSELVGNYIKRSDCGKKGSCHLFRHTMATLMLENGADLRTIQEILGHANLATTQIYTRVSIQRLKEVHTLTHPANASKAEAVRKELEEEFGDELAELPH
jgi:integrase/recombinase XerD